MLLDELLRLDSISYMGIHMFIAKKGLKNVKTEDLDKLIERFGESVLGINDFAILYSIVSTNDANRTMKKWTILIGVLTVLMTIMTLIMLFK